jgi:hypothetical protein
MRALKGAFLLMLLGALAAAGCASRGPLTPEEAFNALKRAYRHSDARAVEELLSRGSLERIEKIKSGFSRFDNGQAVSAAAHLGLPADTLKTMSTRDFILLQLEIGKRHNEDLVREAVELPVIGVSVKGNRASVRVENGMELFFVKEGPYWKFELE